VSVRPGAPAAAASAFLSGLIREPLNGIETEVPIDDDSFESWLCSPSVLITNLCHALALPLGAETETRVINLPGIIVSIADMLHALEKYGGKEALGLVKRKADPAAERILRSWPVQFDVTRAEKLGFQRDESFEDITKLYVEYLAQEKQK
jgi:nucleoside-diphosphate-sugar epimerase